MAEREGAVQDRRIWQMQACWECCSPWTQPRRQEKRRQERRGSGLSTQALKINGCVTYCVQGLKTNVCSWQGFRGGFLLWLFFPPFNAYITLPQSDNCSHPCCQSGSPADPILWILLAWAPWRLLRDSSGDLRTRAFPNACTSSQECWSSATKQIKPPPHPPFFSFFFFSCVHSRYPFMRNWNPMLLSHSVFHYMLEGMSDVSVCWCYSWPSFLTEPLENDIQEVAVHSLPQNTRVDIQE